MNRRKRKRIYQKKLKSGWSRKYHLSNKRYQSLLQEKVKELENKFNVFSPDKGVFYEKLEQFLTDVLTQQRDMICEKLEFTLADFVTKVSYKDEKYRIKMYVYEYLAEAIKEIKNN